jgi:Winged helix DNA-binding domain
MPPLAAVPHLVGLQAQEPMDPYLGLWSRLDPFDPDALAQLLRDRQVVRTVVMRATVHLVTADDCLELRPLVQPVLDQELARHRGVAPAIEGVDLAPVLRVARECLAEPRSGRELRQILAEHFPYLDATALAYVCRNLLTLVQVPPRGLWGQSGQVRSVTAESWLGRPLASRPSIDAMVLRYLAAFGPATPGDVSAWSRLTGMREVVERLQPQLQTFRDERGRDLYDLPDAPRPDPATPAPPRFLPEYDNVVLSHADRSRFVSDDNRRRVSAASPPVHGSVLYDGMLHATWSMVRSEDGTATLTIRSLKLTKRAASAVIAEGRRMLKFLVADATAHEVRVGSAE